MAKTKMVFTNGSKVKVDPLSNKKVPCLFFVEAERTQNGNKYFFSGKVNPLPFKEIIVTKHCCAYSIEEWLKDNGWEMIAKETI